MDKVLKAISITLLCLAAAGSAFAAPGQWRDSPRVVREESFVERQDGGRYRQQRDYRLERQRGAQPDFQRNSDPNFYGNRSYESGSDMQRRPGRMSPEERRNLRRQINEAGRDIYAPYPRPPR